MILLFSIWLNEEILNIGDKVNILSPSFTHSIDVDNLGNVYISFLSSYTNPYLEIYFAKLNSNGNLEYFRNASRSGSVYSMWAGYSNIFYLDSSIYIIWDDRRVSYQDLGFQNEIFSRKYYLNISGGIWGGIENVTENDGNWSINPSGLIHNNKIYVAWQDTKNGFSEIFFKFFDNGLWSNSIKISNTETYAASPSLSLFYDDIYLTYEEVSNGKIVVKCNDIKNNLIFTISDENLNSFNPSTDYFNGKIGIIWNSIINGDIYGLYKEYNGIWNETETLYVGDYLTEHDIDLCKYKSLVWSYNGDIFYMDDSLLNPLKLNETSYFCSNPIVKKDTNGNIFVFWNGYTSQSPDKKIFYRFYKNEKTKDLPFENYIVKNQFKIFIDGKEYKIFTTDGRKIAEEKINGEMINYNFTNLPLGVYFLIINKGNENIIKKIVHIK